MIELVKGELQDFAVAYEAKIEDGKIKIAAGLDIAALIEKGEKAIPDNQLKAVEIAVLEIIKQSVKGL